MTRTLPSSSPLLMLAPMEGLTNFGMRELILEIGGVDVVATEFIRITSHKQGLKPFKQHQKGRLQIQLMASEPETLSGVIVHLKNKGVLSGDDWIDLNVGCPSRRVNSHGAGAALLKTPEKLVAMISQMREVHRDGLLSMKTRLGYDSSENFGEIVSTLKDAPIDLITIHARSKCDAYDPEALELDKLAVAAEELPYSVIGNGDVFTPEDAVEMFKTGVAGCMCGRGAISNPYLFSDIRALLTSEESMHSTTERREKLYTFARKYLEYLSAKEVEGKKRSLVGSYKEFATWFSKNPLIGKGYFQEIRQLRTLSEMKEHLNQLESINFNDSEWVSTNNVA